MAAGSLTAAQICNFARLDAKVPGYTTLSGEMLNAVLSELCQTYNLDAARGTHSITFNPSSVTANLYPNAQPGAGPYPLPTDFLRMMDDKDNIWFLQGVPYPMIPCDLSEYDNFVQQANVSGYPYIFATDVSQQAIDELGSPQFLVWPPASGAYPCTFRYRRQMPNIVTPETSAVVPWFPNSQYLRTRTAGELMKIANDDRWEVFLGDGPSGAQGILDRYLKLKDDNSNRAQCVTLDRRSFNTQWSKLPNTKTVGWVTIIAITGGWMVDVMLQYGSSIHGLIA